MAASPTKGGATPDDIMAPAAMRPLLALSKREPVSAAVGMTADKLGVVLLHKTMKPKKVFAQLKAEAKKVQLNIDSPSLRFGTAEVDPEIDSALVRFRINKEAPGMLAPKLRDHLKKAGFSKVEFIVDPSLEAEGEAEGSSDAQPPAQALPDWQGLTAELTGLAKQIAAATAGDAGRQASLVQFAAVANASLKARQDFAAATAAVLALRQALEGGGGAEAAEKAAPVWQVAKDVVDGQLRALSDQLRKTAIPELVEVAAEVEACSTSFGSSWRRPCSTTTAVQRSPRRGRPRCRRLRPPATGLARTRGCGQSITIRSGCRSPRARPWAPPSGGCNARWPGQWERAHELRSSQDRA